MTVKLEVPFNKVALAAAAVFFKTLADSNPVEVAGQLILGSKVPSVDVTDFEGHGVTQNLLDAAGVVPDPAADEVAEVPEPDDAPEVSDGLGLDRRGFPWDARIHAGAKSKNKDLTWRYKPGVDKALIPKVEAELLQNMNAGKAAAPDLVPDPKQDAGTTANAVQTPAVSTAAATSAAVTTDAPTFADVMKRAAAAVKAEVLSMPDIDQWAKDKGLASKAGLAMNATVRAEFGEYLTFIGF